MTRVLGRRGLAASLLCVGLAGTGCQVGPEPQRPTTVLDAADGWANDGPQQAASSEADADESPALADAIAPWWRAFGDPALEPLVTRTLAANPELRGATASVLGARAALRQAGAGLWPEATYSVGVTATEQSIVLPNVGRTSVESTSFFNEIGVSYQVDLFGKVRGAREAALASLLAQESTREAVAHTVVAETVRARVLLSTGRRSLELARSTRDSWQKTLTTVERRYRSGLVDALDLRLARENLASAAVAVERSEQSLRQVGLGLDVLLGVRPGDGPRPQDELAALPPLAPPPLGLPIELLDRRPDVRAAEWRLRAATSRIGVELADLYPSLTLTGSAGVTSESASDLLSVDEIVYNLFAGLSGPLFDRGRRQAEVLETRADAEGAAAEYASAVLGAAREVEDALVREDGLRAQLAHATTRVEEARAADRIARSRYLRGVETLIRVLETERRLRAAEDSLVALEEALWQARIDLHLAVGGDWSVPSPPALDVLESENFPTLAAPAMATEPPVEASADPSRTANAEDA